MQCPKCGHEQDDTDECRHCGIIFEKYRIFQERQAHQPRRDMMPSTGRTLRQEAAAGIETVRRFLHQVYSYLREKPFQQHSIYQQFMPFFRFLIGAVYSNEMRAYKRRLCDQLVRLSMLLLVTIPIHAALLYFYRSMWHLYQMTDVGRQYEDYFTEKALSLSNLLAYHPLSLSLFFYMEDFCDLHGNGCFVSMVSSGAVFLLFARFLGKGVQNCGVPSETNRSMG